MDSTKKSFEFQAQVRQNAEVFKNTLNDLYSWEKEIKKQELEKSNTADTEHLKTLPVRSHVGEQAVPEQLQKQQQQQQIELVTNGHNNKAAVASVEKVKSPVEKSENPLVANEEKRKRANEIKDRGNKHVKLGEYEKASNEYSAAIDIFPEDAVYFNNRALCYLKLARYNDCIEDCDRAIQLDKMAVKAYYRRMQANESLGNDMDALKDCTSVLVIEPKNQDAKKSLERINERLRKNVKSQNGPNFSACTPNMLDILPIEKPAYKRSNKPLHRVPIADIVVPKDSKNYENASLKISDEDIDKLFNSNCGPFVEVKKSAETTAKSATTTKVPPAAGVKQEVKELKKATTTTTKIPAATVKPEKHNQKAEATTKSPTVVCAAATPTIDSNKMPTAKAVNSLEPANRPLPPAPTSTAQFYSNWKELSPAQKYQYLKSIELRNLCKVLGAGFDSDTLTDILHTLCDYYLSDKDAAAAAATLLEVSKNNQVAILSLLMSTDDRRALAAILNSIKESKSNGPAAASIAKNFNLH